MNKKEQQSVKRIVSVKPDMLNRQVDHICNNNTCNPENELSLIHRGFLSKNSPPITTYVYVCNMQSVHICTKDKCNLYRATATGTCTISGLHYEKHQFSTYSSADQMTWGSKTSNFTCKTPSNEFNISEVAPVQGMNRRLLLNRSDASLFSSPLLLSSSSIVKEKESKKGEKDELSLKKKHTTTTTTTTTTTNNNSMTTLLPLKRKKNFTRNNTKLAEKSRSIIQLLLYSVHRIRINDEMRKRHLRARDKYRDDYIRMCKEQRQRTILSDFARFNIYFLNLPVPLTELQQDEARISNLSNVILHVWNLVEKYYDNDRNKDGCKIDFTSVALGTLYTMRQGYVINEFEVLPQDSFLAYHLPKMKDLSRFDLSKRSITKGEKLLSDTYKFAFAQGASREDIIINVSKMKEAGEAGQFKKYKKVKAGRRSVVFLKE